MTFHPGQRVRFRPIHPLYPSMSGTVVVLSDGSRAVQLAARAEAVPYGPGDLEAADGERRTWTADTVQGEAAA